LYSFESCFFSLSEFYNRCFDAQRLVLSKAALRNNLCCVARDETESDVWNRAQLLEYHPETDHCSLLLVDLGTWQECVPRTNLRHILVPFRNECVRSVPCRLAGIAPTKPEKNGLWNECKFGKKKAKKNFFHLQSLIDYPLTQHYRCHQNVSKCH
jgi:hypothetical protein